MADVDLFLIIFYTNLLFLYIDICSLFSIEWFVVTRRFVTLHTQDVSERFIGGSNMSYNF